MQKKIQSALISVFYKEGLEPIVRRLSELGITIYSTGGTQQFIQSLGLNCIPVEDITEYPSILGGRVKTLHPRVFGGILGRRSVEMDRKEMADFEIPEIDLVIVDLYPFEETVASGSDEKSIIEKIDIGGPSMIRGAAKNFEDVLVVASRREYAELEKLLAEQGGETTREQRKTFAAIAFEVVAHYDVAISRYFSQDAGNYFLASATPPVPMRYGENPHQNGFFYGQLAQLFEQLHGKELSYNNLVDVEAAIELICEFTPHGFPGKAVEGEKVFAIIKHTNVCGVAARDSVKKAWTDALAGDPESAFGGVLVCNAPIDKEAAEAISEIFFEVIVSPGFEPEALAILQAKKNRILLRLKSLPGRDSQFKSLLNGILAQGVDNGNFMKWEESGGRPCSDQEKADLEFANLVCKHLKSNAIALVKNKQLVGKGCGQTSRIDAVRHAIEKAGQFKFDLNGAVMASDAFFPFNDSVALGHKVGITAFIQPGGSIRDKDSIDYCRENNLALVLTGMRHFRH